MASPSTTTPLRMMDDSTEDDGPQTTRLRMTTNEDEYLRGRVTTPRTRTRTIVVDEATDDMDEDTVTMADSTRTRRRIPTTRVTRRGRGYGGRDKPNMDEDTTYEDNPDVDEATADKPNVDEDTNSEDNPNVDEDTADNPNVDEDTNYVDNLDMDEATADQPNVDEDTLRGQPQRGRGYRCCR
ncbi:hypothetical protein BDZ89DRAFT_1046890 [Hymenopellis radicata]|nr:hypothetical protein BDZ89DRAFT_1046890 [Hymenopellis radicata]